MRNVTVSLGEKSYIIYIHNDWDRLFKEASLQKIGNKALIVSDDNVHPLYYKDIETILLNSGLEVSLVSVPPGEESKSLKTAEMLYTKALASGLGRDSLIIALGGGVIGDLAGFVASTYMRGVPFVQVPTSLLAQVDSSIGGKVAVNHPMAKNSIGSFYQPQCVLMNTDALKTLPKRELSAGMAELIKHGIILDKDLLVWLEENIKSIMSCDTDLLARAIQWSCQIKASIVEQDEKEQGIRRILNFGHTAGHAVESITGYSVYTHGEAISIGMVVEASIAYLIGLIDEDYLNRIRNILTEAGLPVKVPEYDIYRLIGYMEHDKKNIRGSIVFILPTEPGHVETYSDIDKEIIEKAFKLNSIHKKETR